MIAENLPEDGSLVGSGDQENDPDRRFEHRERQSHPTGADLYELIRVQSAHYGSLIRKAHGEPYFCYETVEVQDVLQLGVASL